MVAEFFLNYYMLIIYVFLLIHFCYKYVFQVHKHAGTRTQIKGIV